jgi:hypothetical protein
MVLLVLLVAIVSFHAVFVSAVQLREERGH